MRVTEAWVDIGGVKKQGKEVCGGGAEQVLAGLFEVVNHGLLAAGLEDLFNKLQMERVDLVGLFRLLAGENEVQSDLKGIYSGISTNLKPNTPPGIAM